MGLTNLKVVLLCGGESSRMGAPKHSLRFSNGTSVVSTLISAIKTGHSTADPIYISLHDRRQHPEAISNYNVHFLYDIDGSSSDGSKNGPASALLAAHHQDPAAHWLIIACDFPLLSSVELQKLIDNYEDPLTCFENAEGWEEPLLAIWSPLALETLECNVQAGFTGPIKTLRSLPSKKIRPLDERSLTNANTPQEWEKASKLADDMFAT